MASNAQAILGMRSRTKVPSDESSRAGACQVRYTERKTEMQAESRASGLEAGVAQEGMLRKDQVGHWTPPQACMKMEQRADGSTHGRCDGLGCQILSSPMRALQIQGLPQHSAYQIRAMGLQNVTSRPSTNLPSRRCPVRGAGKARLFRNHLAVKSAGFAPLGQSENFLVCYSWKYM